MPKKKSTKRSGRMLEPLYENRRKALLAVMTEKSVSVAALAEKLSPGADAPTMRTTQNRILTLRRATNARKLESDEAAVLAAALGVPFPRLLAGELSQAETAARSTKTPATDRKTLLKERGVLSGERRNALKGAMGIVTAADIHKMLVGAGKKWTRSKVDSYVNGPTLPSKDFLMDVAPLLGVNGSTLFIRDHPMENFGRHKNAAPTPVVVSPPAAASPAGGLAVRITCTQLGIKMEDSIVFDGQLKQFLGSAAKIRSDGQQQFLEVSVPIAPEYASVLLGLVLSTGK